MEKGERQRSDGGEKGKKDEQEMDGKLLESRREEARQHVCNIFECVYVCVTG